MYQALHATSRTLADFIENEINADPFLTGPGPGHPFRERGMHVLLNTPAEMAVTNNPKEGISLWLYRVVRDEERLNDPAMRISATQLRPPPLPLRLHYLVTPVTSRANDGDPDTEQYLLGKVLQLFHSKSQFRGADLHGELAGTSGELFVRLETMSVDEITRVWDALEGSYQLSVSYEVSLVNIDAALEPESIMPVLVAQPGFGLANLVSAGS